MAYNDVYVHRSGSTTLTSTAVTPIISLFGTAAKRGWIVGVRVMIGNTTAAAGNNILFQLARPGNTPNASATQAGNAHDFSSPAGVMVNGIAYTTAPTLGTVVGEWELPMSSGAMWTEFPPTGDEWGVPAVANNNANAGLHVFVTASVATNCPLLVDIIAGE